MLATRTFPVSQVLIYLGIGVGIVVVAGLIVLWLRKRMLAADRGAAETGLLDDLREMRTRGEITDEEFTAAKQAMTARLAGELGVKPPVRMPPPGSVVAKPGFDLTGAKLPEPQAPNNPTGPPGV